MANNSILTPGCNICNYDTSELSDEVSSQQVLLKDNYLSEFESEDEKAVARDNLGVYDKGSVFTKDETEITINEKINTVMEDHLNSDDPHGTLTATKELLQDFVKKDGTTPFTAPQSGVTPTKDSHLTTKQFVTQLLKQHTNLTGQDDPHEILPEVKQLLTNYVKSSNVYTTSQVYTKEEINSFLNKYVKRDGTTSFTAAQTGVDPSSDSQLTTKRYVDNKFSAHMSDSNAHNFLTTLNQKLKSYAKLSDIYTKDETYSKSQINSIINQLVEDTVNSAIQEYQNSVDEQIQNIKQENYVKSDGSIPFTNPQSGVSATKDNELVTLEQLNEQKESLTNYIDSQELVWKTSGPVESTVGFLEDNTEVPSTMTLQEICDAIFYGSSISITGPDYVTVGKTAEIIVCIKGSTALIELGELYQGDTLIKTFTDDDFKDGCVTIESNILTEDTDFTFRVTYTNEAIHEETFTVKCSLPVFVGLLPKWKFANEITMDYLEELTSSDTTGTQNRFLTYGDNTTSITFKYSFEDSELRHPFIVVGESFPDLESMTTSSQSFNIEAFDVIDQISLVISETNQSALFKVYVYKQALSSLNQEVTFNFKSNE